MLGQTTVFIMVGCRVWLPVSCSVTAQSSPDGHMRVSGFMDVGVVVLMFSTCFSTSFCTWS